MAGEGALITAVVTLAASGAFLWTAWAARRYHGSAGRAVVTFFAIAALFLALAGARQVFAYLSRGDGAWVSWDRSTFYLLVVPAAYNVLPLVHLSATAWGWSVRLRRSLVLLFALAATTGLAFVYLDGLEGPKVSDWGTEWSIVSPVSSALVFLVLTLPALAFSLSLLLAARRLQGMDRRRLARVGTACLVYYIVFTTDAFAAPGPALLLERLVTAATGVVAASAYRTAPSSENRPVVSSEIADRLRRLI